MLVLTRKPGTKLVIGGGIVISFIKVRNGRTVIGVDAPRDVKVLRGEVHERDQKENDVGKEEN